jgi:hypothetical protein
MDQQPAYLTVISDGNPDLVLELESTLTIGFSSDNQLALRHLKTS